MKKLVALPPVVPEPLQKEIFSRLALLYELEEPASISSGSASAKKGQDSPSSSGEDDYNSIQSTLSSFFVTLQSCESGLPVFSRVYLFNYFYFYFFIFFFFVIL
jgi:hypothetical protein